MDARQQSGLLTGSEVACALQASLVGTWELDIKADRARVDSVTAKFFGMSPASLEAGPKLSNFTDVMHPDDVAPFRANVRTVTLKGGIFVAEYRVCVGGTTRWILARGWIDKDPQGRGSFARGVAIDITDLKTDGFTDGVALFSESDPPISPLDSIAKSMLEALSEVGKLPERDRAALSDSILETVRRITVAARKGGAPELTKVPKLLHS